MNLDLTLSSLRNGGHRITKVRKEMVRIFSQALKPLSAGEVGKKLLSLGLKVNKTTIYRELQFLVTNEYLVEVYIHPREVAYESAELEHHHHLVCEACGGVDKVADCLAQDLEKRVYKSKGFEVQRHNIEFYGLCANCLSKI